MELNSEWPCWEIMNCDASKECPAKSRPETPCWEIASELNDYRHAMDICQDCVVHLLKDGNSSLTQQEMESIITQRTKCVLA